MLTTKADTIIGTDGDDVITGTSATLQATDTIIDQHSDDNDTLNLTLNAKNNLAKVAGIENVNVIWDAFGTAQYDASTTTGATITGTSSKTGFLGAFSVTGTGANNVVAGDGMTGALTVTDATDTTVTGTASKSIKVDGTTTPSNNLSATVIAGANTTKVEVGTTAGFKNVDVTGGAKTTEVSVDNSAKIVVDAAAATKLTLEGTAETDDSAEITLGVDAKVAMGSSAVIENVTINAADGTEVDITGSAIKNLTIASEGAATLVAGETILAGKTVTNKADSLNIKLAHTTGAADLSKVAADLFTLTSSNGSALTFATGAKVLVAEDVTLDASAVFNGKSATNGTLDLTVLADQTNDIEVTALKTLNLTVELNADDADKKATLGGITSANDVTLTSANEVVVTALAVKNLDASASTGKLTITGATGAASIVGSQGNNAVTLNSVISAVSVITGEGDDKVTLGTADATADVTLVLGNGKNNVDAATQGIKGAALSVVTGSGDDVVKVKLDTSGSADNNVVLELGDGKNSVELNTGTTGGKNNFVTIVTGAGNDTVKFMANTIAEDTINWTADGGTNTLDLGGKNISLGEITLSGVTHILDGAGTGIVDGSLLNGKSYTIQGDGKLATLLDVTIAKAGNYDFSNLVLDATLAKGIGGLDITGSTAGSDKIIGTSGNDKIVASSSGTNTITGGKGQDDLSSNGSTTTFVFAKGDSGKTATTFDTIQDFVKGTDKLKMGIKGDGNFVEVDVDTGGTDQLATVGAAVTAANVVFGTGAPAEGKTFAFLYDSNTGTDGWLAIDWNTDGTVDEVIKMVGLKASGDIVATDIIA